LVRPLSVALCIEVIGKQAPTISRTGLQLHSATQRGDRFVPPASFAARDPKLEMHRRGMRLLARKRLENLERRVGLAADTMGGPENQARMRITWDGIEDLTRLFRGKPRIPLQQSRRMRERNIEGSDRFRKTIHWNIPRHSPLLWSLLVSIAPGLSNQPQRDFPCHSNEISGGGACATRPAARTGRREDGDRGNYPGARGRWVW
jgi:hypothetical protein